MKYDEILVINGQKLTKKHIESLSKQERLDLIEPIFDALRASGWIYPDDIGKVHKEWKRLVDFVPDLNVASLFNNSSLATGICKHFCRSFYLATERDKPTMLDNFNDDGILKRIIRNRLGLDWLDADGKGPGVNEAFCICPRMMVQGQRSMRLVNATSMFKPDIAKYLCMKYSSENDIVYDFSAGFGGRMLGAVSCNRQYIGVDPLTASELSEMAVALGLKNVTLLNDVSENVRLKENSVDFSFSSPPYESKEFYSADKTQAYNQGKQYFYDIYWKQTLGNVRYMLKPNKWFGLNVKDCPQMLEMAIASFGQPKEEITLRTIRSHLTKKMGVEKGEPIYMFINTK